MSQVPAAELEVLRVLARSACDRGEFMSIGKLLVELDDAPRVNCATALRSLKRKRFVTFKDGDAVKLTASGLEVLAAR
ncbi:MAG TPA: hypothetical protein VNK52_09625 [Hyphomicrobiaceae bacterium]|nr:hypothetical protein [Hyphomicrobiaceae bacterium]